MIRECWSEAAGLKVPVRTPSMPRPNKFQPSLSVRNILESTGAVIRKAEGSTGFFGSGQVYRRMSASTRLKKVGKSKPWTLEPHPTGQ